MRNRLGLIYSILVALILLIGFWWVYFLVHEGENFEKLQFQRHQTDIATAYYMFETSSLSIDAYQPMLEQHFPHLQLKMTDAGLTIVVDPEIHQAIHEASERKQRMFVTEGAFFILLLLAGTSILTLAARRERDFKRARELFLAGATHELKTPLACLRLYTETLQRPELDSSQRDRIYGSMVEDVDRLENIIEQVLSVSSEENIGSGEIETFDAKNEIELIVEDISRFTTENNALIRLNLQDSCYLTGDKSDLEISLRNLLRNAVIYNSDSAEISVTMRKNAGRLLISVADNGFGIDKKHHKRIFESFQRVDNKNAPAGSGLGLYLVKRAVESLGGTISLTSNPGDGSTFTLDLPATEDKK